MTSKNQEIIELETRNFNALQKTESTIVCGVARKINIGNFENIDVYSSITLPINLEMIGDMTELKEIVHELNSEGFSMVSKEVNQRFEQIKDLQKQVVEATSKEIENKQK